MTLADNSIVPPENFRNTLLTTVASVLSLTLLSAGIFMVLIPLIDLDTIAQFSADYNLTGIILIILSILCSSMNVISRPFKAWKVFTLIAIFFGLGVYFLFTSWLIMGALLLLLAVFISAFFSSFQISTLVFMPTQIVIAAILSWYALQEPGQSNLQMALSLPWPVYFIQISLFATLFFSLAMILLNTNSQALVIQEDLKERLESEQKLLEQRVAEQTRALDVTQEINQLISTTINLHQLLGDIVEKIRQAFGFYHVQVYMVQSEQNRLKIAGATGESGTAMLIGGHTLKMEEGVVGKAASTQSALIIDNVLDSTDWIPNSFLPDTVAEIAVPITKDGITLGVLDIQHDKHFDEIQRHIHVLYAIAKQLGIAIGNVSIFQKAAEQLDRNRRLNEMSLKLQLTPDIHNVLNIAGEQLVQSIDPVAIKLSVDPNFLAKDKQNGEAT